MCCVCLTFSLILLKLANIEEAESLPLLCGGSVCLKNKERHAQTHTHTKEREKKKRRRKDQQWSRKLSIHCLKCHVIHWKKRKVGEMREEKEEKRGERGKRKERVSVCEREITI